MKQDFLIQHYIIFNCIIGLDDSRREALKIKALVFPGTSNASDSLSVGTLYMDNHGMLCFPILPEGRVNVERHRVQFLGMSSLRQHLYPEQMRGWCRPETGSQVEMQQEG